MKKAFGLLLIVAAIFIGVFGGFGFLIYGAWELITADHLSFGNFFWAVLFMIGRDILAWIIAIVTGLFGYFLLND